MPALRTIEQVALSVNLYDTGRDTEAQGNHGRWLGGEELEEPGFAAIAEAFLDQVFDGVRAHVIGLSGRNAIMPPQLHLPAALLSQP